MNYIVFDLEFNQSLNSKKENKNLTNLKCPFEIIQIGAVKLDENLQIISILNKLVKPELYTVMNPFVEEMTGITIDMLNTEQPFQEVYKEILEFIGNDKNILCVWGACDIKELFRNIQYHNLDISPISKEYINIQFYASKYLNCPKGTNIGLKNAAELLNINIENKFHNALNDAYYTAEVFKKIPKKNINIIKYDVNKNMKPTRNNTEKSILDTSKLIKQFEKMFNREMSEEEQKIIKLAYMMGKTRQFEIPHSDN
ncbi:exonuclease [Clostridium carboxidivorans P7]|uniref:Exonuclease RNase T and DNA polymerase III n=1 Tax=Clostridium carboxidivorans P7 TaxID=536227 RepID=C6PMX7_9CLOT|nr:3'-5' exonuclease [Clostridium carboxidivorans]AKN30913.1 exonuclease [Clostridium carboxidivorans P7]EET89310.1 Exonuclease RNase T and DNA polymerase III [Clostridium carboxidivorans P7]EFG88836.1 exonuclease [Clostridium carboxidivorans P7]